MSVCQGQGGGLFNECDSVRFGGPDCLVLITNSAFTNNSVSDGTSIYSPVLNDPNSSRGVMYLLPAPPGSLITPTVECQVLCDPNQPGCVPAPAQICDYNRFHGRRFANLSSIQGDFPTLCALGHYCDGNTSQKCPAGTLGNDSGLDSSECNGPFPLGSFCPEGSTAGIPCPAGRYGPNASLSSEEQCLTCEAGYWCQQGQPFACGAPSLYCPADSKKPLPVPPGNETRGGIAADTECTNDCTSQQSCSHGHWCSAGKAFPCSANSYLNTSLPPHERTTQDACVPCGPNAISYEGSYSQAQCNCTQGYYRNILGACVVCPEPGSNCLASGVTLQTLPLKPGYWRINNTSSDVRRCPDVSKNASSACQGLPESPCKAGLNGIYCRFCVNTSGTYFSSEQSACLSCARAGGIFLPILLGSFLLALVTSVAVSLIARCTKARVAAATAASDTASATVSDPRAGHQLGPSLQVQLLPAGCLDNETQPDHLRWPFGGRRELHIVGVRNSTVVCSLVKSCARFIMQACSPSRMYATIRRWRRQMEQSRWLKLLRAMWSLLRPLLPTLMTRLKICWSFYQIVTLIPQVYGVVLPSSIVQLLRPITSLVQINVDGLDTPLQCIGFGGYLPKLVAVTVAPLILMLLAPGLGLWLTPGPCTSRAVVVEALYRTLYLEQLVSFVSFPIVSSIAFSAFECEHFDGGLSLLKADYHIRCHSARWAGTAALAVGAILLHVFLIPLCFLALLVHAQRGSSDASRLHQAMGFLHAPYQRHSSAWEFVEMAKKLLLVGFARVLFEAGSISRLLIASIIALCSLTFLTLRRPYLTIQNNYLNVALNFALACILLLCVGFKMGELSDDGALSSEYRHEFGLSSILMSGVFGAFVVSGALLFLVFLVLEVREEHRRASLLSQSDLGRLQQVCSDVGPLLQSGDIIDQLTDFFAGNKHTADLAELEFGQPEGAARDIYHHMRVCDPLADGGKERIIAEVEAFLQMVEQLSDDEVVSAYKDAWEADDVTAASLRAKVRMEVKGNLDYVIYESASERQYHNGIRDEGRGPVTLEHFVSHPIATQAELSDGHVIALRYYTTHAFKYLNNPLRRTSEYYDAHRPHPLPVTVAYISQGLKKLRAVQPKTSMALWRGMRDRRVSDDFMHDRRGGTEVSRHFLRFPSTPHTLPDQLLALWLSLHR